MTGLKSIPPIPPHAAMKDLSDSVNNSFGKVIG